MSEELTVLPEVGENIARMVTSYIENRLRLGTDWKNGLAHVITLRLNRLKVRASTQPREDELRAELAKAKQGLAFELHSPAGLNAIANAALRREDEAKAELAAALEVVEEMRTVRTVDTWTPKLVAKSPNGRDEYRIECGSRSIATVRGIQRAQAICDAHNSQPSRAVLDQLRLEWTGELVDALQHMRICGSCAEGSWTECEGGREALAALAPYAEKKEGS